MGESTDDVDSPLVAYLAGILEPELARRVCRSRYLLVDGDLQVAFLDCDDEELGRLSRTADEVITELWSRFFAPALDDGGGTDPGKAESPTGTRRAD